MNELSNALSCNYSVPISSIDLIKKEIEEDGDFYLTHEWLLQRFQEVGIDPSSREASCCYKAAEERAHPFLRPPAEEAIKVHDYTLNFFWINRNPQDRLLDQAQHIFKNGTEEECEAFFTPLSQWASFHKGATIHIWYDSAFVTEKARQQTFLKAKLFSVQKEVNLRLRDLRELHIQEEILKKTFHPSTPLYYRVDLLKALVTDHLLTGNEARYCVLLDIDIEPSSPKNFFDQRTLQYLDSKGHVFNRTPDSNKENSGMIFDRNQKDLASDHYEYVLESAARDLNKLEHLRGEGCCIFPGGAPGNTSIFEKYSGFESERNYKKPLDSQYSRFELSRNSPRKPMQCPRSQFNGGACSSEDRLTHLDQFWFEEGKSYPTLFRRAGNGICHADFVKVIEDWIPEPLPFLPPEA